MKCTGSMSFWAFFLSMGFQTRSANDVWRLRPAHCVRGMGQLPLVRGRLVDTAQGLVFTASLDRVRGLHVAEASVDVESAALAARAVPNVVTALLEQERAFRTRMIGAATAAQPGEVHAAKQAESAKDDAEPFLCHASQQGLISWGDVSMDDGGMSFTSPLTNKWRKSWSQMTTLTSTTWGFHPALYLQTAGEFDPLYIWFDTSDQRDRCVNEIQRRLDEHHHER